MGGAIAFHMPVPMSVPPGGMPAGDAWLANGMATGGMPMPADAMVAGDLALVAALSLGVLATAAAVAAFLRMTGSGRRRGQSALVREEPADGPEPDSGNPPRQETDEAPHGARSPASGGLPSHDAVPNDREAAPALERTIPLAALPVEPAPASDRAEPRLCGISGDFFGRHFRITDYPLVLGRDPAQCGLVFRTDAAEISRRHCSLSYHAEKGVFLLQDHGSSNGTFLRDGRRLEPNRIYELRPGDRFSLSGGRHWFEVRV